MRVVSFQNILNAVSEALIDMNYHVEEPIVKAFYQSIETEASALGKSILKDLILNAEIAATGKAPICQDTGMVVAFVTYGQDIHMSEGSISEAIHLGVKRAYAEGYLRKSVVRDPLKRINTGDNTPAIIYYDVVPGDVLEIELAAKGFGSENMSATKMLKPSDGKAGVKAFVIDTILKAGSNPCPPIVVGVGIGGTIDKAAQIAKRALFRDLGEPNTDEDVRLLEEELLSEINALGIGPQGLGGTTTALAVHVETFPTHIAGLPVAVNINCHASRHKKLSL